MMNITTARRMKKAELSNMIDEMDRYRTDLLKAGDDMREADKIVFNDKYDILQQAWDERVTHRDHSLSIEQMGINARLADEA